MVQVRGTVHDVSDNPDRVEKIVVRAVEPRMHGTTYITEESAQFPVVNGVLDFDVLPGPCAVAFLRPHGSTTYAKLLVPDAAEATFKECLDAADLAEGATKATLENAVRQVQQELSKVAPLVSEVRTLHTEVSNDRTAADGFAKAAKASASAAASSQSKAKTSETNAASSAASAESQQKSAWSHFNNTVKEAEKAANSATAAKTSETKAASSASASASSASSASTQAGKSATSATQAGAARDAAKASETAAAGSAAAAKTSETAAKQSEGNAGDYAAVATTAATEAVGAMERATEIAGGDFATREYVTDAVANAIRVDTTAGTAVYAGDTLIFGDTGTRVITSWDEDGTITYGTMPEGIAPVPDKSGGIYIRRVGQRVTWSIICAEASVATPSVPIPDGFRVTHEPYPYTNLTPIKRSGPVTVNVGSTRIFLSGLTVGGNIAHESSSYGSMVVWDCTQPWPTSLPGIPR